MTNFRKLYARSQNKLNSIEAITKIEHEILGDELREVILLDYIGQNSGAYGLNIVAALSGTVETVSYDRSSGNYVVLNHGNGVRTKYLHCSSTLVQVGQKVTQGQTIAKVGDTGVATGPHLHFSITIYNSYVDPYTYLKNVH